MTEVVFGFHRVVNLRITRSIWFSRDDDIQRSAFSTEMWFPHFSRMWSAGVRDWWSRELNYMTMLRITVKVKYPLKAEWFEFTISSLVWFSPFIHFRKDSLAHSLNHTAAATGNRLQVGNDVSVVFNIFKSNKWNKKALVKICFLKKKVSWNHQSSYLKRFFF